MAQSQREDWADALASMSSQPSAASAPRTDAQKLPSIPESSISSAAPARSTLAPPRKNLPFHQSIEYKRTLIPILLTCGVLLPALSLLPVIAPESVMGGMPAWVIVCAALAGVILLALAAMNMMQVKHQLQNSPKITPPRGR